MIQTVCAHVVHAIPVLAMKYGGSSPRAVPAPHINASHRTLLMIAHILTARVLATFVVAADDELFGQIILHMYSSVLM